MKKSIRSVVFRLVVFTAVLGMAWAVCARPSHRGREGFGRRGPGGHHGAYSSYGSYGYGRSNPGSYYGGRSYLGSHYGGRYNSFYDGSYYRPYWGSYYQFFQPNSKYSYRYHGWHGHGFSFYGSKPAARVPGQSVSEVLYVYTYPERPQGVENPEQVWAWEHLARGNFWNASAIFEAMERQTPAAGWPKVGTGLLAGFGGDYNKSVYQFRRAFRFDPKGPGQLPDQEVVQSKLTHLTTHFRRLANQEEPVPDAEFMVAALSYLGGDFIAAQNAIEKAVLHGDDSRSTRNLQELVELAVVAKNKALVAELERE